MRGLRFYLPLGLIVSVSNLGAAPIKLNFDFGQTNTMTTNLVSGQYWNNVTNAGVGLAYSNLLTSFSALAPTNSTLTFITSALYGGGWYPTTPTLLGEFNATSIMTDGLYYFGNDTNFPSGISLKVTGLDRNSFYTLNLTASRNTNVSRTTIYTVTGANSATNSLQTSGPNVGGAGTNYNVSNVVTFSNITPNNSGEISVNLKSLTTNSTDAAYLNGLQVIQSLASSSVTTVASDVATNAAYNSAWTNGANAGTGFGPWQLATATPAYTATNVTTNVTGGVTNLTTNTFSTNGSVSTFVGSVQSNGFTLGNMGGFVGKAWGLQAEPLNSGAVAAATRLISNGLAVGQILSFRWGLNYDSSVNGDKGFRLYGGGTNSNNILLQLSMGGSPTLRINDSELTTSYGRNSFLLNIERRKTNQLRVFGTGRNGSEYFNQYITIPTNTPNYLQFYAYQTQPYIEARPYFSELEILQPAINPSTAPTYSTITLAGSFQGWNPTNNPMSPVAGQSNTYRTTLRMTNGNLGTQTFKFTDGTWNAPWGSSSQAGYVQTRKGNGYNISVTIPMTGLYAFQFNPDTLAYSVNRSNFADYAAFAAAYGLGADAEDADGDGLTNGQEYVLDTDPLSTDTDGDGLADKAEGDGSFGGLVITDPLNSDTDGDGLPDGWEVSYGLDPTDNGTRSAYQNYTGLTVSMNPNGPSSDPDGDGLTNQQEYVGKTSPLAVGGKASAYASMVIAGNFNFWNPASNDIFSMNLVDNWTWQGLVYFASPPSDPRFQFAANGSWTDKWGEDNDPADGIAEKNTNTGHIRGLTNVITSSNRWALVTFNENTRVYSIAPMPTTDADNDGIPDAYEVFYGARLNPAVTDLNPGVDLNGDGLTNLQNFKAGTLPVGVGSPTYAPLAQRWADQHALSPEPTNAVVFVGSSSIRRYESLKKDFADYQVIQRGSGGSTFEDVNQLISPFITLYRPRAVVVWSGVNDLYNNGNADMVFERFTRFCETMNLLLPNTKIFILGITRNPSFAGNNSQNSERLSANSRISSFISSSKNSNLFYVDLPQYFESLPLGSSTAPVAGELWSLFVDDKHLNATGYGIWTTAIRQALMAGGVLPDRVPVANALAPQGGKRILFDFGPIDTTNGVATVGPDARGNVWNNWYPRNGGETLVAGERKSGLVDSDGNPTGLILTLTGDFQVNGKLNGGLTNLPSQALGNLATVEAAQDFFYTSSDKQLGGGNDDVSGGLMISGLDPTLRYDLKFLCSRAATDIRQTLYEVYGASSNSVVVQSTGAGIGATGGNGNDKNLAVLKSIQPNIYGDILVDVSAVPTAGNANIFGYLNAMELSVVSPYESWARSKGLTPGVNTALAGANLETFALDGSSMDQASVQGKVQGQSLAGSGGQALQLALPVRKGAGFSGSTSLSGTQDGVTYEVLGSSDLINWNLPVELVSSSDTTGLPSLADPSGYEYRKFRIKDPSGTLTKGFLKSTVRTSGDSSVPAVAGKTTVAASSFTAMQGVQVAGGKVGFFEGGDWLKYGGVDFGNGATSMTFSASKAGSGGTVEIRLGSPTGRLLGTFIPQDTGGWSNYREQLVQLSGFISGVQDVYLVATGGTGVCNLDSFRFSQYVLAWGDEFEGSSLNPSNWAATWNGDVGNGELQFYTDRTNNVCVANGVLQLTAQRENYTGQGPWMTAPKTTAYTSGLIESLNKVQPQYGKIEASMKIPRGAGLWPAFWMMGANYFTPGVGWPLCGEIDIMEYAGNSGGFTAAFHTGAYNYTNGGGGIQNVQGFSLSDYDTAFHVYGIEWTPNRVAFYVDGKVILEANKYQLGSSQAQWPFDQPFWIKINLAVGGSYGGDPATGTFPKTMEVDWIRVYQEQAGN